MPKPPYIVGFICDGTFTSSDWLPNQLAHDLADAHAELAILRGGRNDWGVYELRRVDARWWHSYDIQQHQPQLKIDGTTYPQTYIYQVGDSVVALQPDENKSFYSYSENDGWAAIRCVQAPAVGTWHEGRPS